MQRRSVGYWVRRAIGEASKLVAKTGVSIGSSNNVYALNSIDRMDYELARKIYRNIHKDYKLGAHFARPVIDACVGFMGVPSVKSADREAQSVLEEHFDRWGSVLVRGHRNAFRDGDQFFRLAVRDEDDVLYKNKEKGFGIDLIPIPPERVKRIETDPETGRVQAYLLQYTCTWGENDRNKYTITEKIEKDKIIKTYAGDLPPDLGLKNIEEPNKWGFIPIIHFKNEAEDNEVWGRSDLEPIEPLMKAYHDVLLQAISGSKMHSTPKVKFKVSDYKDFILRNFGVDIDAIKPGEEVKISFDNRDVIFVHDDEDVEYLSVSSPLGGADVLLKFIYWCIVDVSGTPEFVFGTAVSSSKASVSEQMIPLIRKIKRKRSMFEESYLMMARMLLAMWEKANGRNAIQTYNTWLDWEEIVPKDEEKIATVIEKLVNAFAKAVETRLMSLEAAASYLADFVPTMMQWAGEDEEEPGERERIIRDAVLAARLGDAEDLSEAFKVEIEKAMGKALGGKQVA